MIWLVLELVAVSQEPALSSGFANVMGGFVDKRIASYPALTLWLARCRSRGRRGCWTTCAQARAPACRSSSLPWPLSPASGRARQMGFTRSLALGAEAALLAVPDGAARARCGFGLGLGRRQSRARRATVWNTRQIWRLYRANWQGMLGLCIMVFFAAHGAAGAVPRQPRLARPDAQITRTPSPRPASTTTLWFGSDEQGMSVLRRVHLERPHLARRGPLGHRHLDGPRGRRRHHRRLLRAAGSASLACGSPTPSW